MQRITIKRARTWHCRRMRHYVELSNGLAPSSQFRSWLDCIINTSGCNFRKGQVGDPLSPTRCDVEIAERALDKRRYTTPKELRILIGEIGWRIIAKLLVHSDFFKFIIKRIGLAQIMGIAELANEIGGAYQRAFFVTTVATAGRKARGLDGIGNSGSVD